MDPSAIRESRIATKARLIFGVHEACPPHSSAGIVANMTPSTVAQYLAALPADRRAALSAVRKVVNENQRSDPADCRQRKVHASPEASALANPTSFAILLIAANNQ